MLLDLFSADNYINVNMNIAKIFDINTAVYSSLLLSIYKKAYIKNTLIDGMYFKLDRTYVKNKTTLTKDSQLLCDVALMSAGLMTKKEDNIIYLNIDEFIAKVTETDASVIKEIKLNVKDDVHKYKSDKSNEKKLNNIEKFSTYIGYSNPQLFNAVKGWIIAMIRRFGASIMSKTLIDDFKHKLENYTKGNIDSALKIIDIATVQMYRDVQWAIDRYDRDIKKNIINKTTSVRTSNQKVATRESINSNVSF